MYKVGIAGGSGYGGLELIHVLLRHPEVKLVALSSEQHRGKPVEDLYPHLAGLLDLRFSSVEDTIAAGLDILFLALPHGKATEIVPGLPDDLLVIDLSGDFRLRDPGVFQEFYGFPMADTTLQRRFVYGLPEINRPAIRQARRIANPGCFATATILALYPLVREGWIEGTVFVDSKTGSSGSGRSPSDKTHHPRRSQALFPYKPFKHQHLPEIRQALGDSDLSLVFQPYSTPLVRGIFASHYLTTKVEVTGEEVAALYGRYYGGEPFIRWSPRPPDACQTMHSNYVDIGAAVEGRNLIVWSTLDNLQKGAAGQAVQNMNLACGLEETLGLENPPLFP
ncbi:MAG: N-acetyl-gamma-glutamyl-phosphate reductase [Acidobacteriota bacterium]